MKKKVFISALTTVVLSAPAMLYATSYTWTGTTSNAWNVNTNWGGSGFPNSYTDQATIPSTGANRPVSLSTIVNLGIASGNALTISGASSGITSNSLDITSTGLLGMQGGISIGTRRTLTIEGTLRNDAASSATTYAITGSPILNGGTISSLNGGGWTTGGVSGYGTISSPITGTLSANASTFGNAMNISNTTESTLALAFSSNGSFSLNNVTVGASGNMGTAITLNGTTSYSQFTNPLPGTYGNNWGNNNYGLINVTGNTTINGGISVPNNYTFNITNGTLNLNNPGTLNGFNTSSPPLFVLGAGGNLNISGNTSLGNSAPIPINGGSITHTTGTFSANSFIGNGSVSGVTSIVGGGNVTASGGTLNFNANVGTGATLGSSSGSGANLNSSAGSILDLAGTYTYLNPGFIAPNGGVIQFDGATINAGTWSPTLNAGTINVTNNSTLTSTTGGFNSAAHLTINNGETLNASGATLTNNGTVANNGTATWGNFTNNGTYISDPSTQTFNNLTVGTGGTIQASAADIYQVIGNFINNSTQNAQWDTTQAALAFLTGNTSSHIFALAGADYGQAGELGETNNFTWGQLDITGQTLNLSDGNTSNNGTALYVEQILGLSISGDDITNIFGNGFNIYYDPSLNLALNGMTYNLENGGVLTPDSPAPVPEPATMMLFGTGLVSLAGLRLRKKE